MTQRLQTQCNTLQHTTNVLNQQIKAKELDFILSEEVSKVVGRSGGEGGEVVGKGGEVVGSGGKRVEWLSIAEFKCCQGKSAVFGRRLLQFVWRAEAGENAGAGRKLQSG